MAQQTGPVGIYLDRIGHYVTDGGLAVAVGVHADGGLGSIGGWTTVGLAAGFLVLITKAETDLVHVARVQSGRERIADTAEVATPRSSRWCDGCGRWPRPLPFNRALLAMEMTVLALIAGDHRRRCAAISARRGSSTSLCWSSPASWSSVTCSRP